ncbi:unnamed protein product, partial [marine sediment metagenome]
YVDIPSGVTEFGRSDFSVAVWVKTSTNGAAVLAKSDGDGTWERHEKKFYVSNSGDSRQKPVGSAVLVGNNCDYISGSEVVGDGEWHHVAWTWDTGTKRGRAYVDSREGVTLANYNGGADNARDKLRIGFTPGGERTINFIGLMDDLRVYNRVLLAEEVKALHDAGLVPQPPSITSKPPEVAYADALYKYTVAAEGNPAAKITVKGLPAWLTFDGRDTISGTPSKGKVGVATASITVTATNGLGTDAQRFRIKALSVARALRALTQGLVGWWKFDEGRGNVAKDSSGKGHHGAIVGGRRVKGKISAGLAFDGVDDYVEATGCKGVLGTKPRTASAWIKTTDSDATIVSWGSDTTGNKWVFRVQNDDGI